MSNKAIKKTDELVVKNDTFFSQVTTRSNREFVIENAEKELAKLMKTKKMGRGSFEKGSFGFKAMTLKEFDNDMLLEMARTGGQCWNLL